MENVHSSQAAPKSAFERVNWSPQKEHQYLLLKRAYPEYHLALLSTKLKSLLEYKAVLLQQALHLKEALMQHLRFIDTYWTRFLPLAGPGLSPTHLSFLGALDLSQANIVSKHSEFLRNYERNNLEIQHVKMAIEICQRTQPNNPPIGGSGSAHFSSYNLNA